MSRANCFICTFVRWQPIVSADNAVQVSAQPTPTRQKSRNFHRNNNFLVLVCQSQMPHVIEATNILIRYILSKLKKATNAEIKLLLPALKSLCEGKSQDQDFDQIVFALILRNAKLPETSKSTLTSKFWFKRFFIMKLT